LHILSASVHLRKVAFQMERFLTEQQLCAITGESVSTVQKRRVTGTGIPFVRIGRLVRYRQSDVDAYLGSLPAFRSTSEAQAAQQVDRIDHCLGEREAEPEAA